MGLITSLAAAAVLATGVSAHGRVDSIVVNGVYYLNYNPGVYPYQSNPPPTIGWIAQNLANDFISPSQYQTPDIICHRAATPATGHVTVNAGDKISLSWVPKQWPHKGAVLDYLAKCPGNCESVDKTTLQFFKIDAGAYVSGANPGTWVTDQLIADNSTWLVQIPASLAPGNYVLRHEIIALHNAETANGAQNYPQCINLVVKGTGTLQPSGVLGTALYKSADPGIAYNLYTSPLAPYTIPGPTLVSGLPSTIAQSSMVATATASATTPGAAKRQVTAAPVARPFAA